MMQMLLLWAEEEKSSGGGMSPFISMLPYILIFVMAFYLFLILPQRQRKKQMDALFSALKKNDKVITNTGVIGVVTFISEKGDEVVLKLEEGKMRLLKSSIARIIPPDQPATETGKS
jgi:preprotein translocase subunit YajC